MITSLQHASKLPNIEQIYPPWRKDLLFFLFPFHSLRESDKANFTIHAFSNEITRITWIYPHFEERGYSDTGGEGAGNGPWRKSLLWLIFNLPPCQKYEPLVSPNYTKSITVFTVPNPLSILKFSSFFLAHVLITIFNHLEKCRLWSSHLFCLSNLFSLCFKHKQDSFKAELLMQK